MPLARFVVIGLYARVGGDARRVFSRNYDRRAMSLKSLGTMQPFTGDGVRRAADYFRV